MGKIGSPSAVSALLSRLAGKRLYLDTNVFIYFLQANEVYLPAVAPIIEHSFARQIFATTSHLAISEVMIHPYRNGSPEVIAQFKAFFARKDFLSIVGHSEADYDAASMIAGQSKMKLIDALHYLAALRSGCQFLVTNDRGFKSGDSLEVIQLDDLLSFKIV